MDMNLAGDSLRKPLRKTSMDMAVAKTNADRTLPEPVYSNSMKYLDSHIGENEGSLEVTRTEETTKKQSVSHEPPSESLQEYSERNDPDRTSLDVGVDFAESSTLTQTSAKSKDIGLASALSKSSDKGVLASRSKENGLASNRCWAFFVAIIERRRPRCFGL